ncbi:hypothetical protein QZH41_004909 [Actinostola sp. cb2023]|nr:hypothetical protein QZH41_004047 [Actinostola sp. cb2023]KAK3728192.1 hypothetical protein QZH41_004909 [Actinostola sp. cb2023]
MTHKMSVVNTLLRRAKSIPSTEDQKKKEREHVRSVLTENNYPPGIIRTCERTLDHLRDGQDHNSSDNRDNETATVVLPYVKGISERVQRVLKQHNIRVAHRPMKKLANVFPRPKDPQDKSSRTGIVYKIKCDDCDFVYYGQTERSLKTIKIKYRIQTFTPKKNMFCFINFSAIFQNFSDFTLGTPHGPVAYDVFGSSVLGKVHQRTAPHIRP